MVWSVTGWSGGSRQPLTYRLRAGQFRGMGTVRGYSNNIFINNNYQGFSGYNYGYNYGCNCDSGSSTPKWMNWMMGLGLGTSFFGNIMSMFGFGGGGAVEGQGGSKTNTDAQAEADKNCKNIRTLYGDDFVKAVVFINGKYNARLNDGTILDATEPSELINKINEKRNTKTDETTTDDPTSTTSTPGTGTSTTVTPTPVVPKLFDSETMSTLTTEESVINKFTTETSSTPVKIDDVKSNTSGITISLLVDKGIENGDKSVNINLSNTILNDLSIPNSTKNLGNIQGKAAFAQNVDGYIKINIGGQDYIIGKDSNNNYKGFQYNGMNGFGVGTANWTSKTK